MQVKFISRFVCFVFSLLLIATRNVNAQMEAGLNKDSLKKALARMPADSGKVQTLIRLGQQYEANKPDSALYYYANAGKLSEQLGYTPGTLRYIANYTALLNVQGKFTESLRLNLAATRIARNAHLQRPLMRALINTGVVTSIRSIISKRLVIICRRCRW